MGCHTFQYHRHTILMCPLQELLTNCQSHQNGLSLSLASPRRRRRTRNGSGIARSAARTSARVKAGERFVRTLVRIVVRLRSVREGTVSDRIRHALTRGRKLAGVPPSSLHNSPSCFPPRYVMSRSVSGFFCLFHVCTSFPSFPGQLWFSFCSFFSG